jgi:hypothetical protein
MDNAAREAAFSRCYARWAAASNFRRFRTAGQSGIGFGARVLRLIRRSS